MTDIWYMLQNHQQYVYHYTSAATLTDCILADGQLRFSRFQNVNDPRESKNWRFGYFCSSGDSDIDSQLLEASLNDSLKHSWRIGCFVSDTHEALATRDREIRGEDIFGAVYERGHSRPRMWAQYGSNYEGACLVFDKTKLNDEIQLYVKRVGGRFYSGPVEYRNPPILLNPRQPDPLIISIDDIRRHGFSNAVEAHLSKFWRELFFVKSRDWEQEREYRWLIRVDGNQEAFIGIKKALVGVALGDKFPNYLKASVGRFAELNRISLAVMNWQNGVPQPSPIHWRLLNDECVRTRASRQATR